MADDLPVAALTLQFLSHAGVGFELVEDELLDDVAVDELRAVESGERVVDS